VIICDDGSIDNSKNIIDDFISILKIKYLYETNWGGPARPRNLGIKNASFDWICFLDSDDLWVPEKLEKVALLINRNKSVEVICHLFSNNLNNVSFGKYKKSFFYNQFTDLLINGNAIVNSSLTIKKELLLSLNGLSEDRGLIGVEDYDLLLRISKKGVNIFFLKINLGIYRINSTNISADYLSQVNKVQYLLNSHSVGLTNWHSKKIKGLIFYLKGTYFIKNKDFKNAKTLLFKSFIKGSINIKIKSILKIIQITFSY
jgi:glycosyltransferase involved in cell wall biosynthesis